MIATDDLPANIQHLIDTREAARIARNWADADAIRAKLALEGYTLEDSTHGPKVTKE